MFFRDEFPDGLAEDDGSRRRELVLSHFCP